jgi:hypothetical protein
VNIFSEAKETYDFLEQYKADNNEENIQTLEEIGNMKEMDSFYIFGKPESSQLVDQYNLEVCNSCSKSPNIIVYRTNGRNLKGLLQKLRREYGC